MIPRWASLKDADRAVYRATMAFLAGRLDQRATIDWALRLKPNDGIKRAVLLDLIDSQEGNKIGEPWRSAWRLIEESWDHPVIEDRGSTVAYHIQQRLKAGDRSGVLVAEIVKLVSPKLKVQPFSEWHLLNRKPSKRPRSVEHLFSTRLTSRVVIDPHILGLQAINDIEFLVQLANALDAAVIGGLDIARRIGWDGEHRLWHIGQLDRVYYVQENELLAGEHDPDEFSRGIAPSVKLLHFVVWRLSALDTATAIEVVHRWRRLRSPIHLRLWAALSRDSRITSAKEVVTFLLSVDDRYFWSRTNCPEIAELRAMRFTEFAPSDQAAIAKRLRKRPPRNQWPRNVESDRVEDARLYSAVQELRRIEVAGATLPKIDQTWLRDRIRKFPNLISMSRIDEGFVRTQTFRVVQPNPDAQYDLLHGEERLKSLESALSSTRGGWEDDPAERASVWIRQNGNSLKIIADFESQPDGGAAFSRVWEAFGWAHSQATEQGGGVSQRDLAEEAARVLSLLNKLPERTVRQAIGGISNWLSVWQKKIVILPKGPDVWLMLWPIAVAATNAEQPVEEHVDLKTVAPSSDDDEPMDLDTLNTPAGKLVGVFLASCPKIDRSDNPFVASGPLRTMRDTVIAATGRAGLIVKHRLIEGLPYFLRADPDWTQEHLITPLTSENIEALALWRAIGRQTHFSEVLKIIGGPMAERATDKQIGRETRRSLVFSLIVECLHALRERRTPAVPYTRVQQMIRSLDAEVRAYGAGAIQRFVRDLSAKTKGNESPPSPEELFRSAAKPFLQQVWPQERSLSTPGVSQALADVPVTARGAFAEAVDAIERFLVPFECWSMLDYGLYGEEEGEPKLSNIDDQQKATAFLHLLDRTIGDAETSVIPMDLGDALDQVRKVAPSQVETQEFRRLATAARRV
jgi:hypothetical protein